MIRPCSICLYFIISEVERLSICLLIIYMSIEKDFFVYSLPEFLYFLLYIIIYLFLCFDFLHVLQNYLPICNNYFKIFLSLKLLNLITEYLENREKKENASIT